jgi:type I restriction enzyme, S subunit
MTNFITKIGQIADIYDGPHATPKKTATGPYFLSISSLDNGRLDLSKSAHLDEKDFKQWTRRVTPQEGDLLFSYETRLGEAALMPAGIKACLGRRMGLLRSHKDKVIPEYLLYAFLSPYFQQTIISKIIRGATVDRIALNELPSFNIRIPSLEEQKNVSRLLKNIDTKIELNNRINTELEAIAKTLYDYWFVQFDFPDVNGKTYKSSGGKMVYNSTLNRVIPEGWEVKKIGEVTTVKAGGDKPQIISVEKTEAHPIPIYSNGIVKDGLYGFTDRATINTQSVTISARGTIGHCVLRNKPFVPIIRLIVLTPHVLGSANYFYENVKTIAFEKSGSVQQQLTVPQVSCLDILYPPIDILKKFEISTSCGLRKIEILKEQNLALAQLRDWLLPMLMNGQVRVN